MASSEAPEAAKGAVLLASVFFVAIAGLVYELIAGTLSTYLLGGSVLVFSVVIGMFLSAMGVGAWLAQYVERDLARVFVIAELALAAIGGTSALALFAAFTWLGEGYTVALAVTCLVTGALVGLEIPVLLRIVQQRTDVRVAVSQVLAIDYLGALAGSLAFPLLLLPYLGLVRAGALVGVMNAAVAVLALSVLRHEIRRPMPLFVWSGAVVAGLLAVLLTGAQTTSWLEDGLYQDDVVYAADTRYQRVVVTRWRDDVRLFLDGHLQFSTRDEYRYHEALVLPALRAVRAPKRVLVLGGGDGLGVQRVLSHPAVRQVDLVDLDPDVLDLFSGDGALAWIPDHALDDPRVTRHAEDAIAFLERADTTWDVIIVDLPDPHDEALARLYARSTFRLALRHLAPDGALATQATSPFHAPDAFWCIVRTLEAAASDLPIPRTVRPGVIDVPSFGSWGVALLTPADHTTFHTIHGVIPMFLNDDALDALWRLPADVGPRPVEINTLGTAVLARYYRDGWTRWQ